MTDDETFAQQAKRAILGLAGATTAAADQADAMTDAELADRLLTGRWTTIEVHEAGRRLAARAALDRHTHQDKAVTPPGGFRVISETPETITYDVGVGTVGSDDEAVT